MADVVVLGQEDLFGRLGALSNREVLQGLRSVLVASRRLTAEVVAHLSEVEERRLHLEAGYSSMFDYCVQRLGLSEGAAYRRYQVARLARRFPAILGLLASGELSLSVLVLLKAHLNASNASALLAAVARCSVARAREVLVEWFPQPDVPSYLRKLPERSGLAAPEALAERPACAEQPVFAAFGLKSEKVAEAVRLPTASVSSARPTAECGHTAPRGSVSRSHPEPPGLPCPPLHPAPARIEPLSPGRYKVQLTADATLKAQLELARALMRHAVPNGDFGVIIGRALELLIERLKKERFGARPRRGAPRSSEVAASRIPPANAAASPPCSEQPAAEPLPDPSSSVHPSRLGRSSASVRLPEHDHAPVTAARPPKSGVSRQVTRAARRAVTERDGLGCSWVGDDGQRCGARAWLELDHHHPLARGGSSAPHNLRWLCRNHNRLAAEREYGRSHIERATKRRRGNRCPGDGNIETPT
jgi:hypothetical protein